MHLIWCDMAPCMQEQSAHAEVHINIFDKGMSGPAQENEARIKKRKYLRRGCIECKRRKIKCDEALPECFNCTRLHKKCSYPVTPQVPAPLEQHLDQSLQVRFYKPKEETKAPSPKLEVEQENLRYMNHVPLYGMELPFTPLDLDTSLAFDDLDLRNLYNEANLLVTGIHGFLDGNDAVRLEKSIWEEAKIGEEVKNGEEKLNLKREELPREDKDYRYGLPENSGLIAEISAKAQLDQSHMAYLQTLTDSNLSYHLFPFASSIESNEVIKILLNYAINCEYLLNALLAIAATFQFNLSGDRSHEALRQGYIRQCFVALSAAFKENLGFQNTWIFTNNVEKLLLTVLVLSSNFTACSSNDDLSMQWIAHLNGARDLLLNYLKIKRKDDSMSSGLALAKCWFFAIESSAAIHSGMGGSLLKPGKSGLSRGSISSERLLDFSLISEAEQQKRALSEHVSLTLPEDIYMSTPTISSDDEASKLRQIFQDTGKIDEENQYTHALRRAQLLSHHNFNLFWGYTSAIAEVHMQYAAIIEEMKTREMARAELRWTMHLMGAVDACLQDKIVPHVKMDTFIIPPNTRGHPSYQGVDKVVLKPSCYIQDGGNYRSWFDLLNQFHCDDLYLKILTSRQFMALPRLHPDVQSLIRKIFAGSFFIKEKPAVGDVIVESKNFYLSNATFDERCVMIQSVFRGLSGVVQDERDFERVELYYLGLVKLGNGSSLTSLDMLTKCRKIRERKQKRGLPDDDVYDLYETLVIPFA